MRLLLLPPRALRTIRYNATSRSFKSRPIPRHYSTAPANSYTPGSANTPPPTSDIKPILYPDSTTKPKFVTTPIFYVNANPHVGHLYSLLLADIFARYSRLLSPTARTHLLTGTDEHGLKVQKAAADANTPPQAFCDGLAARFESLVGATGCEVDRFIRTTDADHKECVGRVWEELVRRGWVYKSEHKGWYSVSDETFYTESSIEKRVDEDGVERVYAIETGKEVEWTSEENWHFRLSAFREPLLRFFEENPKFVVPRARFDKVIEEVEAGLTDLSISRSANRLTWGIPVPGDETQTIYVWLDALFNYLTYTLPDPAKPLSHTDVFPPTLQIIGKDILRFHSIYWPAFLMALDLPLPMTLLTHAHFLHGHRKMSKSVGNVIDPFYLTDKYGIDAVRFYLAHDGALVEDADFTEDMLRVRYTSFLKNDLGNGVNRVLGKKFNIERSLGRDFIFEDVEEGDEWFVDSIIHLRRTVQGELESCNLNGAVRAIAKTVQDANTFFHQSAPWSLKSPETQARQDTIVFLTAEAFRIVGILLRPVIPEGADALLDLLGVKTDRRDWEWALLGIDREYGKGVNGKGRVLYPALPEEGKIEDVA